MYKKLLFSVSLVLSNLSFAETVDHSKGNSNPFVKYEYKSDAQWNILQNANKLDSNINYFNNNFQNPIVASKGKKSGKYKHLIAN